MHDVLDSHSVLEVLRPVQDPELRKSLVELNMIRNVKIDGGQVSFTLVLTTPACPLREFIVDDCKNAVQQKHHNKRVYPIALVYQESKILLLFLVAKVALVKALWP
jgi:metal-sulfur cluster biosynthetic enzyme